MSEAARRILMVIFLLGIAGITAELLLLAHYEDASQLIPIGLAAASVAMSVMLMLRPSAASVRVFQVVMLLMCLSGGLGAYLHLRANMEFQLEMDPALQGFALLKKSVVAKAPPALAPGAMLQLGLIGLAYTFRHPATGRDTGRNS